MGKAAKTKGGGFYASVLHVIMFMAICTVAAYMDTPGDSGGAKGLLTISRGFSVL